MPPRFGRFHAARVEPEAGERVCDLGVYKGSVGGVALLFVPYLCVGPFFLCFRNHVFIESVDHFFWIILNLDPRQHWTTGPLDTPNTNCTYHEYDPSSKLPRRHRLSTHTLHLPLHQHLTPTVNHDPDQFVLVDERHVTFEANEDRPVLFITDAFDGLPNRHTHIHKRHTLAQRPPMRHDWYPSPGPSIPPHVDLDAPCGGGGKEDVSVGGGGGTTEQLPAEEVGVV